MCSSLNCSESISDLWGLVVLQGPIISGKVVPLSMV